MAPSLKSFKLYEYIFYFSLVTAMANGQNNSVPECCLEVTGNCRIACEKISLIQMALNPEERKMILGNLHEECPYKFFWVCMDQLLHEIDIGQNWFGRSCCHLPKTPACQMQCVRTSHEYLLSSCGISNSENTEFSKCFERQKYENKCCNQATNNSCRQICKNVFSGYSLPTDEVKLSIKKECNHNVLECIKEFVNITVSFNISKDGYCCEESRSTQCRSYCRQLLSSNVQREEIVELLKNNGCDQTEPNKRLWNCIGMKIEPSNDTNKPNYNLLGLDKPKLQCCSRAVSTECHKLCTDMSSNDQSAMHTFERHCVGKFVENDLLQCLADVDEPCEVGCPQLIHCTNFNDHPTDLFRACNNKADNAANTIYSIWQRGVIRVSDIDFHLIDISQCNPDIWKTLACTQNLKPCQKLDEIATKVCRADCEKYFMPCIDKFSLSKGKDSTLFCDKFAADSFENCISLAPYLSVGKYQNHPVEFSSPCLPNPCGDNDVCITMHNCLFGRGCLKYSCVPGCRMGERSHLVVAKGTYVQIPLTPDIYNRVCYKVCYCNLQGELENCKNAPCGNSDNCWNRGKKIPHNTQIKRGCNICFCYAGALTCTQKQCDSSHRELEKNLPCNCPDHYVPVCGSNGKTYPSACVARCDLLSDDQFEYGACFDSDPCSPNSCNIQQRCVPRKRVCLSINHKSCKQYDCVDIEQNCNLHLTSPVCDKDNIEHKNLCWMLQKQKSLAYYGKCMHHCRSYGVVCGHNGETYDSECAAWAERVSVDYRGPCVAVGAFDGSTTTRCNSIKCPPLPSKYCPHVYPPGGCCPVCGAALRLLFTRKMTDWIVETVGNVEPVVVQTLAEKLRQHVKILECDVFAFLSVKSDIIALIVTTVDNPTELQIEACIKEAEKLESLIQKSSPILLTDLSLSFISGATMIEPTNASIDLRSNEMLSLLLSIIFYCLFRIV